MKKLRSKLLLITLSLLMVVSFVIELHYTKHGAVPLLTRLMLLALLNMTIISLFILMFFVAKSLVKLYFERKHKVLGYKFKTKLVIILVVLTLIPSTALFVVSSGLITNYIDRWFSPQIKQPLESSIEIAKAVYDIERQKTLDYAKTFPRDKGISEHYHVEYFSGIPKNATETIKLAFEGKEGTEVISGIKGDIVRAAAPAFREGSQNGVIVVESSIPLIITRNVENIKDAYENYLALESWKVLIKANYLLILGFLTLVIAFMALWIGLRISRGITDPIQSLAQATESVATGNLDITVPQIEREDEIGLLIESFNHMVRELKEKEKSLQSAYFESDTRRLFIENILDNINSGVIMLDITGQIIMINKRACSIVDIKPETVLNHNYRELISMIHSAELQRLVSGIEGKEFRPVKKEVKAVIGGRQVILLVFIASLRDAQKYIGLLVVFDDLTDIIEAQRALTWQDVARKIAHEIKNPLTPIKLSTERMMKKWEHKDTDFDEVFHRSTRTIVKEVDSLKRLVDEFSKFGKMPEIHKTPTSIPVIIDEVVNLYKDYKGIELSVTIPENPPQVELDGEQFKRVIINMFDNATQAMKDGGMIDVKVGFDVPSDRVYIDIADNGTGIKDEIKEKLFLPYFSTKKDGTGLGLAIANRIIKEHGGHIKVRDNKPTGTVFTIVVPIKEN
jgi:two-component system, NtrC family, nitrogen regulation sensor histidine kinase NtrY